MLKILKKKKLSLRKSYTFCLTLFVLQNLLSYKLLFRWSVRWAGSNQKVDLSGTGKTLTTKSLCLGNTNFSNSWRRKGWVLMSWRWSGSLEIHCYSWFQFFNFWSYTELFWENLRPILSIHYGYRRTFGLESTFWRATFGSIQVLYQFCFLYKEKTHEDWQFKIISHKPTHFGEKVCTKNLPRSSMI